MELAQYEYMLPRLTKLWTHLERQRGGTGTRGGAGEKEIETDRRLVRDRIALLKSHLRDIDKQMATQRGNRGKLVRVALVGYTNVGKSTLMNLLSKSDVFAENKLFATLDTTVRKVVLGNLPFLLSDTVGFIRKLPTQLIESFKSTLDETREADLLLHVVDAADPLRAERIAQVDEVLQEIGAGDLPQMLVFNKIDRIEGAAPRHDQPDPGVDEGEAPSAGMGRERVWISARDGQGIDLLKGALAQRLGFQRVRGELHLPANSARLRARLHALGAVLAEDFEEHGWRVTVDLALADAQRLASQAGGHPLEALLPKVEREDWQ